MEAATTGKRTLKSYDASGEEMEPTTAQLLEAAWDRMDRQMGETGEPKVKREFALAKTAIEEARMRATRGLAMHAGVFNEIDLETEPGFTRARDNFEADHGSNGHSA